MKRFQCCTSDIISTLPSNVTDNILKCLPLRDAVRTSALSSRWRYTWVTLSELIFDEKICGESLGNEQLKTIIYQLRGLDLLSCEFKPPPTFKGFSRLINLDLQDVHIGHEMFGNFISNCPLLERLVIDDCTRFGCLEINAPNLQYFWFRGSFKSICFFRTTLLAEIAVILKSFDANIDQHEEGKDTNLVKIFHCLSAIENLGLDDYILEFMAVGNVPKRLLSPLNCLKTLNLNDLCFDEIGEVSCALCLIRSSPDLQKLKNQSQHGRLGSCRGGSCCRILARARLLGFSFE